MPSPDSELGQWFATHAQPHVPVSRAWLHSRFRTEDAIYGPSEVVVDGDALRVTLLPSKRRLHGTMAHWHHDTFRVDFPDRFLPFALFRFELGTDGKVSGFRIDCPIADFDFAALDFRRVRAAK
mgnify:CR=1 FL=1